MKESYVFLFLLTVLLTVLKRLILSFLKTIGSWQNCHDPIFDPKQIFFLNDPFAVFLIQLMDAHIAVT